MQTDLKIGLGVCFLDSEKEIPRMLGNPDDKTAICNNVTKIYGIHGRFINYEAGHDYSIDNSEEAMLKYPNAVVHRYKPAFQTEMRQHYLDLAGEDKMDYLIVMDTDDILYPSPECQNWAQFYKNLKRYAKRFPDYRLFKMKSFIPDDRTWRKAYNAFNASNSWVPYIRIHKDPGTMRYCLYCHYWWAPKDASDEDLIMQRRGMFIADQTIDGVRITTNSFLRKDKQLDIRDNWAWNNIQEEQRRLYIMQNALMYTANSPNWIPKEFDGYWRYDKDGRPISKICNEDGSPPESIVPKIKNKTK